MDPAPTAPPPERDPVLADIVTRLVDAVDPDRIVLFGSRVSGRHRPDSDYDILIIKPEPDPALRRTGPLYRSLWGLPASVDLLWFTPDELEDWSRVRQHIATQAVRNGIVVYERSR